MTPERITMVEAAQTLGIPYQTAHTRLRVRRQAGEFTEAPGDRVGTNYYLPLARWRELIGQPRGPVGRPRH